MPKAVQFFMPMDPPTVTHQEKRCVVVAGKPRFFDGKALRDARTLLTASLASHRPQEPLEGPLLLWTRWVFPDRSKRFLEGFWRVTRPDTDNLSKLLKDCMTASGFWKDDSQVVCEVCSKVWTRVVSGIHIYIQRLPDTVQESPLCALPFTEEPHE